MKKTILIHFSLFLSLVCLISLISGQDAHAQNPHSLYCQGVDSTAGVQDCLKRHRDSAQKDLNKIYDAMVGSLEGDDLKKLKEIHEHWLAYRDQECDWEAERTANASLKQINKMSCLARMTEARAALLKTAHTDDADPDKQRQFSSFPRWMNALAKDQPSIFWDYGARLSGDLNCDGNDDLIMSGLLLEKGVRHTEDGILEYPASYYVAISDNPPTGRPQAQILKFDVGGQNICALPVRMSVQDGEMTEKGCSAKLVLQSEGCDPAMIVLTGKSYGLYTKPEETEQSGAEPQTQTPEKK